MLTSKEGYLDWRLRQLYSSDAEVAEPSDELRHAEVQAMADAFLGQDYDQEKIARVMAFQDQIHEERERLDTALRDGRISSTTYLTEFKERIDSLARRCESVLGRDDFEALFGTTPDEMKNIVDDEIFLAEKPG